MARFSAQRSMLLRGSANLRRVRLWILLATGVGLVTGLLVAGLHLLIQDAAWGPLSRSSAWWIAPLPLAGLLLASASVARQRDRTTDTTEDFVRVFHDPNGRLSFRSAPFRLMAAIATISLGGSMGLEGPSIYIGAVLGDLSERLFGRTLTREDAKVLLVAGAAAGISAIFKAPVTGIVFALEVPYRDDLARHALIPAMFASSASYLVFAGLVGTAPLFPVQAAPLRFADLLGSLLVGVACGIAARVFILFFRLAGRLARMLTFWARPVVAGVILAVIGWVALAVYHLPLALGPGYNGILRAARGQIGPSLLVVLLVMKIVATSATAAGGGVGGLFFPAVMMGAATGGALGHLVPGPSSLFAVVGIAAFIGGAYKVPLAGVAFVAETTGAPGYIIPGLLAAAIAYLVSGRASISSEQRFRRMSELETRLRLTVREAMSREWTEVPPTASVTEFATTFVTGARAKALPVAEGGIYLGLASLDDLAAVPSDLWPATPIEAIMRTDRAVADPGWPLERALRAMREEGLDRLPVVEHGRIVGVVSSSDVLQLEEILEALGDRRRID